MGAAQSQTSEAKESEYTEEKREVENENDAQVVKLPYNYESILREADPTSDDTSATDKQLYDQLCHGVFLNQKKKAIHKNFSFDSNVFVDVAELLNVCWLEIHGRFDTAKLSPGILYEAVFLIMLKDPAYGWEVPVNLRLTLPNGTKQEHKEYVVTKPRAQWIEVPAGEFVSSPDNIGRIEISMYDYEGGKWKRGLVVKGVTLRPKNQVSNIDA
ncbi:ATPP2-A2, putative [Ricinus communis]|uniref:ATPP2-A2, putative n=1 Tax=Ricinus communis TaxID=3988 RepID=B9SDQ5_RICCO|nr:ATPP2-A2, putative [Ricinus communis]